MTWKLRKTWKAGLWHWAILIRGITQTPVALT